MRLTCRQPDDALFLRPDPAVPEVTAATFLRAVRRVASLLPSAPAYMADCTDRCAVAVAVAAAAVRGVPCLLTAGRSQADVALLRRQFPGAHPMSDADAPGCTAAGPVAADAAGDPAPNPSIPGARTVAIGMTSGSTGTPTLHRKSWEGLAARSLAAARAFDLSGGAIVSTVPATHMYGFETTVMLPLHAPVTVWCGCPFYPADVAAALQQASGRPILVTTPVHLAALVEARVGVGALSAVISATAPLDRALAARAEAAWQAPVYEIFGATEVGSIASRRTTQDDCWALYPEVDWTATADGSAVTAPGMPPTLVPDRFEDLGQRRFRLAGRLADVIKRGGRRASLAGLAQVLGSLDGVRDAAFFAPGLADERPVAFAVAPGGDAGQLLAALRARIDPVFAPRRIVLLDRLPRDPLGKLPRAVLAASLREVEDAARPATISFAADHPCFAGHFPGRPLVPGALLLAEVAALAEAGRRSRVGAVTQAKFFRPVTPGETVEVAFSEAVAFSELGGQQLRFACRSAGALVAEGALQLVEHAVEAVAARPAA